MTLNWKHYETAVYAHTKISEAVRLLDEAMRLIESLNKEPLPAELAAFKAREEASKAREIAKALVETTQKAL